MYTLEYRYIVHYRVKEGNTLLYECVPRSYILLKWTSNTT